MKHYCDRWWCPERQPYDRYHWCSMHADHPILPEGPRGEGGDTGVVTRIMKLCDDRKMSIATAIYLITGRQY